MQVSIEDVSSVKKVLHIEIPEKDVTREVNNAYKDLNKSAKIKGFRSGKVPRPVLERHYKKDVDADLVNQFIQDSVTEAIRDNNLMNLIGAPRIDPPELEYNKPYKFDAIVELHPELNPVEFKGIELKKNIYKITDKEIETQLKAIQRNQADLVKIEEDRPAQADDYILMDYEGFKDGQPFEEAQKTENFTMKIGGSQISKELDDNIIGMKLGETKDIVITFPEDYKNQKIANQTISFNVTLKEIRKEILPEINDDLAKKLGTFDNIEQLKKEISFNLSQGYTKRTEQELHEQIFNILFEQQDFEAPESMIEAELASIISDTERSFSYHNMSMEDMGVTRESLSEKYRDVAENQVKRHFLLGKIVFDEKLELPDEELDKALEQMAASFSQPVEVVKQAYKDAPGKLEEFRYALLEKKAISLILENSNIEEVEMELEQENQENN